MKKTPKPLLPQIDLPKTQSIDPELDGVTEIGSAFKAALPLLQETERKFKEHCDRIRQEMKNVEPLFCPDHEDTAFEIDWDQTFGQSWKFGELKVCYGDCPDCRTEREGRIVNDKWKWMGIPLKVIHATFDNFNLENSQDRKKVLNRFKHQLTVGKGFIIAVGMYGTGKSHLGAATIKAKGRGRFITLADLIGKLRKTYDEGGQERLVEEYRTTEVFVLDELTTEVKGSDVATLLYRILSYRYDRGLLTIITSNEELDIVLDILGPRLKDRIKENYSVANFTWESARKAV